MRTTPHTCSFGGFELPNSTITGELRRTLVRHEYPGVEGADLEDTGAAPYSVRMRCSFYGDDFPGRFFEFLNICQTEKVAEFVHPVLGPLGDWRIESASDQHPDDEENVAYIDLSLVRDGSGAPDFVTEIPAPAEKKSSAIVAARADVEKSIAAGGRSRLAELKESMRAGLRAVTNAGLTMQSTVGDPLREISNWADQIDGALTSWLEAFEDVITAPDVLIRTADDLVTRLLDEFVELAGVSPQWLDNLSSGSESFDDEASGAGYAMTFATMQSFGAAWLGGVAGGLFETYALELEVYQAEQLANVSRARLNAAVQMQDAVYAENTDTAAWLLALAADVLAQAKEIIENLPPEITVVVERDAPLALLAHEWTGDAGQAEAIARRNKIRNPYFVEKGTELKVPQVSA